MSAAPDKIFENLKRVYNQTGFMDRYGTEVWVSSAIIVAFLSGTTYFSILNRIEPIKADWDNQKCHPAIIPIAGFIKKPKDMSALAFTAKNLGDCTYGTLIAIFQAAVQPFYYMLTNLNGLFAGLVQAMNNIRKMFDNIRNSLKDISTQMFNRVLALTVPIMAFLFNTRAILEKMVGVFTTGLYTLLGSYITMKTLFKIIVELLIKILIILFTNPYSYWNIWDHMTPETTGGTAQGSSMSILKILLPLKSIFINSETPIASSIVMTTTIMPK